MAIVITNLSPTSPTTPAGQSVVFNIGANDNTGLSLSYEWQYSTDGANYSSSGLSNNTSNSYDTGPLTASQTGIYFRCVVSTSLEVVNSNEYTGIGDRIVSVFQDPSILAFVDSSVDFFPTSQVKTVGDTLVLTVSASLANADITNSTLVSNLGFQWQYSDDSGSTWFNIVTGGNTSVSDTVAQITGNTTYMKYSTLSITNITFAENLYQYRVRISYTGALNTPVDTAVSQLIIDPVINIIQQPGVNPTDTQSTDCYKTSISNSGEVKVSVSALTTAGTGLTFSWEVNFSGPSGTGEWYTVDQITNFFVFSLKTGTTSTTDVLELDRFIYYERPGFRCVISGSAGEATVTTTPHYIYMTDVQGTVDLPATTYDIEEDRWGDIPDRDIYVNDPVQDITITALQDVQRNTGQNGNNTYTWQRQDPGSSTWTDLADPAPVLVTTETGLVSYSQFPTTLGVEEADITVETPPLRVSIDDNAKYRVKVESSSIFTLSGGNKVITPYYSSEIDINVYPTIYVTNQPGDSETYPNYSASFSVSATPSSGLVSDITYQWQYNTNNNSATGWVNISNTSPYTGATTNLLTIDPVPVNLVYGYFRCVLSIPNQLSSVTSEVAYLTLLRDYFTALSALNDVVVREFDNHTFSVTASSVSAGPISFQWEKSLNYNPATNTGTWTNISGETNSSLSLLSIGPSNDAFYRVRCTSSGGEVLYSNAAKLTMQEVNVTIINDIVTSISVLEGTDAEHTFECEGLSSINTEVEYQWEIKRISDSSFGPIGAGFNNSIDTNRIYILRALNTSTDTGAKIRCKMVSSGVPGQVYTNECTVTVTRRFSYFADVATKTVTIGEFVTLDLNPFFTGGNPSYSWERNGATLGETGSTLTIPNVDSSYSGASYRCLISLTDCTEHSYSRNNTQIINTVSGPTYTATITLSTTAAPSEPTYYSDETAKTGAAIGSVICVAKPPGYVNSSSSSGDDVNRWDLSRFPGYLPLKGDSYNALQYPELARMFGTKFGGSISGLFPNYSSGSTFKLPETYGKRMLGTGNVDNNAGSTSVVPTFDPSGVSGGDKNVPGSMGGVFNYVKSAQLPPGSPGVSGLPDGTADGSANAATFSIGSYQTTGIDDVNAFVQPTLSGGVAYVIGNPGPAFTDLPTHNHTAVSVGWRETQPISNASCFSTYGSLNSGTFPFTTGDGGTLSASTTTVGAIHSHTISDAGPGFFDMVVDAGMNISDTTLRFTGANASILNNNMKFYLRNNEKIPINAPYFRLKYLIKAY
jgi:hypothetical protein